MKLIALAAALAIAGTAHAQQASAPTAEASSNAEAPGNDGASTLGGYAPADPLFSSGTVPPPGAAVVFVPSSQTPTEAFPPPPPKASYPICKPGQFDGCRQPDH
jgi:hypothetical protein